MRLHELKPARGSRKESKRLGRGNATGQGTTAGKGTKGEKARAGGLKAGFRGMSSRNARLPKRRGFTNRFKEAYHPVNVGELARFDGGSTVGFDELVALGLADSRHPLVKILGDGDLSVPLHLVGLRASAGARAKIEAAGGTVLDATNQAEAEQAGPPIVEQPAIEAGAEPEVKPTRARASRSAKKISEAKAEAAEDVGAQPQAPQSEPAAKAGMLEETGAAVAPLESETVAPPKRARASRAKKTPPAEATAEPNETTE
jgi:large subunit ribosomal protein L15